MVGYVMSDRINTELTVAALKSAIIKHNPKKGIIHHSDRGIQYVNYTYKGLLEGNGIISSMSAKGNPYDNACMESFNSLIKKN